MLVDGEWTVVPPETIQYRTLEGDGGAVFALSFSLVVICAIVSVAIWEFFFKSCE